MIGYPGPDYVVTGGRFDIAAAENTLRVLTGQLDATWPSTRRTLIEITTRWPEYQLPDDSPLKTALLTAARQAGLSPAAKIAGPSNIGNYLAGLSIPATAGFGVDRTGEPHGPGSCGQPKLGGVCPHLSRVRGARMSCH